MISTDADDLHFFIALIIRSLATTTTPRTMSSKKRIYITKMCDCLDLLGKPVALQTCLC